MNFRKICSAIINGRRWSIGFGYAGKSNGVNDDGACNYSLRRIIVHAAHSGRCRSLEETVIHEVAHAHFPQIDEPSIAHFGEVCAKVLIRLKAAEPDNQTL